MKIWRRNAVVATVLLFVCVALYLNWSYNRADDAKDIITDLDTGKTLGEVTPVNVGDETDSGRIIDESDIYVDDMDAEDPRLDAAEVLNEYFSNARLSRQKARDSALALLKDTAESDKISQEARDNANNEITLMAQSALKEAQIESLVVAKGYKDCVAHISEDELRLVVAAPAGGMTKSDIAKITEIATKESGLPTTKIKITEI